jgi:surfeit locus 1 family protein
VTAAAPARDDLDRHAGVDRAARYRRDGRTVRSPLTLWTLAVLAVLGIAALTALGVWQFERRVWKLQLIDQVDQRIHAAPVPVPGPDAWPRINAGDDAYRRVTAAGRFLNEGETLVQAVTERGGGYWVMTPFRTDQGFVVLVNRGFVRPDRRDPTQRTAGQVAGETTITGLLRMSEPKGGFLRANDPQADRWYSRDVAAIAASHGFSGIAPFFIDADATPNPGGWPIGGLTVIAFPNNHLVYALTWFGLALMLIGAMAFVARDEWRIRRRFLDTGGGLVRARDRRNS